jgi:hypothetical protein
MPLSSKPAALPSILQQRCPRCRSGRIFRNSILRIYRLRLPHMYECCPVCGLTFEREEGYFLGAMYISYGLALSTILLIALILWMLTRWWITTAMIWAVCLFLPLAPAIALFSRVLWIYLDQKLDPER